MHNFCSQCSMFACAHAASIQQKNDGGETMSLSPSASAAAHAQRPLFDFLCTCVFWHTLSPSCHPPAPSPLRTATLPCALVAAATDGMVWRRGYYQERGVTVPRAASSSSAPPRYAGLVYFSRSLSLKFRSLLTLVLSSSSSAPRSPPAAAAAPKVAEVGEDCGCGPEGGQSLVRLANVLLMCC